MTQRYLNNVEEQNLGISLGRLSLWFHFYPFRDLMYVDIKEGTDYVAVGKRVMANQWILPSYIGEGYGNVRFEVYESDGEDYVWWEQFNTKFRFMLYSDREIKEMEQTTEA